MLKRKGSTVATAVTDPWTLLVRIGEPVEQVERQMAQRAMDLCEGHVERAAELLGIHFTTLYRWKKQPGT